MLALGIDPGTAICGYGVIETNGSRLCPITYGAIETSMKLHQANRLKLIYEGLNALIEEYQPDIMGVEQLFFNKNVTTAITVGQARGVILLAAAQHDLQLGEYTPLQVKQAVAGYGRATKDQVTYMVQKILNIREKPKPDDAADALAIAICALHSTAVRLWEIKK